MKRILACLLVMLLCLSATAQASFSFPDDVFLPEGEAPVVTENSYQSDNISISITSTRLKISEKYSTDVYVADIYVRDLACYQRYFVGTFNPKNSKKRMHVGAMAEQAGAILAITGDSADQFSVGWVMGNGEIVRHTSNSKRDIGLLLADGQMRTILAQDIDYEWLAAEAEAGNIWQLFCFGPALLDENGHALTKFNSDVGPANPRSVLGYYEPGHYCFVQVDGRKSASKLETKKKNQGLTLIQLAQLMEELGCSAAYNLDGGDSSLLWFNGNIVSSPSNKNQKGRLIGDIVMIIEPTDAE